MEHYEYEINLFVDGELPEEKTKEVFAHLAECTECRKLFSEFVLLEKKTNEYYHQKISKTISEFNKPANTGMNANKHSVKRNENKNSILFYKAAFYISTAVAIILVFFLYDAKYILNSENHSSQFGNSKNINVETAKTIEENDMAYLRYVMSLRTEKITENDRIN